MEKKEWEKREMNREEIDIKIHELEEQIIAFELRVKYEEKQIAFREIYLEWYNGRITLGELLQAMIDNGLCNGITVFER
jgi:translation initiation factor RLI1